MEDLECTQARPATVPCIVILAPHSNSVGLRTSVTSCYTTEQFISDSFNYHSSALNFKQFLFINCDQA